MIIFIMFFFIFPVYLRTKYPKFSLLLFVYHFIFIYSYWNSVKNGGSDATAYWFVRRFSIDTSKNWFDYFGLSTNFLLFLNYPFVKFFNLNFFSGFLIYGSIGFLGIMNLYKILKHYTYRNVKIQGVGLQLIILFLPNMHFWTSAIGKDSLSFFLISCIILASIKNNFFNKKFFIVSAFLFFIRPHICIFLLGAIGATAILRGKHVPKNKRFLLALIGVVIIPILISLTLSYVHLDLDNLDAINENFESANENLSKEASSAIPMSNYALPLKIFSFLFRPFLFDIRNVSTIILAIENSFLLVIFIYAVWLRLKKKKILPYQIQGILVFAAITTLFYCYRLSNLGIIIRMKNMILPFLLVYPYYLISTYKPVSFFKRKPQLNSA